MLHRYAAGNGLVHVLSIRLAYFIYSLLNYPSNYKVIARLCYTEIAVSSYFLSRLKSVYDSHRKEWQGDERVFENLAVLSSYVQQFGAWAPAVAFLLFVIQAAVPVFPYIILAAGGGMLFGFKFGVLLAWSGALTGACLCYWVCRLLGYNSLSQWIYARYGYDSENHSPSIAFWSIVISRVLPFVPTPLINVGAALGGVPFPSFLFASALGKIPTAVLYTGLGLALFNARDVDTILLIIAATFLLLLSLKLLARKFFPMPEVKASQNIPYQDHSRSEPADARKTM